MPRPRYEPEARHAPLDAALYKDFMHDGLDPGASSRDMTEPPLGLDTEPVPGAFHVGRTYSAAEWRARQAVPAYERTPEGHRGPGDDAPHRRVELAYRQAFHRRFGLQPVITPRDHVAVKTLIDNLGLDKTLDVIRERIDRAPRWRRVPITVQVLAAEWPKWRV